MLLQLITGGITCTMMKLNTCIGEEILDADLLMEAVESGLILTPAGRPMNRYSILSKLLLSM